MSHIQTHEQNTVLAWSATGPVGMQEAQRPPVGAAPAQSAAAAAANAGAKALSSNYQRVEAAQAQQEALECLTGRCCAAAVQHALRMV